MFALQGSTLAHYQTLMTILFTSPGSTLTLSNTSVAILVIALCTNSFTLLAIGIAYNPHD